VDDASRAQRDGLDSARLRWLTVSEADRLQNASAPDFRQLVCAALQTGCRAGDLLAVRAGDYDPHSATLLIPDSNSGKPRRVPLTEEGVALFAELTAGKGEGERLFLRADGSRWHRMAVVRAMRAPCDAKDRITAAGAAASPIGQSETVGNWG
jgi:integrase